MSASVQNDDPQGDLKPEQPDWAEVVTTLLCHTSMGYEEILDRTLPQIEHIMSHMDKHIDLGGFGIAMGGEVSSDTPMPEKPPSEGKTPKLSELAAFCGQFRGVGK